MKIFSADTEQISVIWRSHKNNIYYSVQNDRFNKQSE